MYVYINVNIYIFHSHKKPPSPPLSDSFISPCLLVLHRNFVGEIPFNHMGVLKMGDPQSQKGLTYTKSLSAHDLDDVGAPPRHRKPQNSTLSIP